ncbi:hypothetical protein [Sphingobium amiense]|uniref:hypothetical protein n=1 Tax=Sphingobium amiense TaxID=135719 RepID=UPI0014712850|nr:hypothetical protein [Sphingobium amiense]
MLELPIRNKGDNVRESRAKWKEIIDLGIPPVLGKRRPISIHQEARPDLKGIAGATGPLKEICAIMHAGAQTSC